MSSDRPAVLTRRRFLALVGATAAAACSQPGGTLLPTAEPVGRIGSGGPSIVVAVEAEPQSLVPTIGANRSDAPQGLFELVHQSLVTYDDQARPVPRLARALPSLSQGTWKIHDDGTMETVWQLRPEARWHDGEPFTADDLFFSWRVFSDPSVPASSRRATRLIDSIESPDPHTAVVHWRSRYAYADQLSGSDLTILPSHLLEASFDLRREQIVGHPYWRSQFVGLGPFRLEEWAGGTIRLAGVKDYFLGPPRLDGIAVRFMADDNTAMASLFSGAVDFMLPRRAVQGVVQAINQRWRGSGEGSLSVLPGYNWVFLAPQFNGAQPEDLVDPRIRQALLCALDRGAIAEAVTGDRSLISDLWMPTTDPRYQTLNLEASSYPFDPARARELFREAGWRREGVDDVLVKQGRRFDIEITTTQEWERAGATVVEYWREAGVSLRQSVLSRTGAVDRQSRASYSGVELGSAPPGLSLIDSHLNAANIPSADTQWVGGNRGHFTSTELDDALERSWTTLNAPDREQAEREIARRLSAELPLMGLFFYPAMSAVRNTLQGVRLPVTAGPTGHYSASWNAHEWHTG